MVERFLKIILNVWVVFASILSANIFPQNEFKDEISRQIIYRDQIKLSGISRLSDLFPLFNDWHSTTIDGYRWNIYSIKTPFDQNQNWILMLDNQKIDLNFFDVKNINFLPISSRNIDSIEVYSSTKLHRGEFSEYGIINISSRKPPKGFSFHSEIFTGNESGDPGPYKYVDELYSENIDIIGPDYSFGLEYGSEIISATINYKTNAYIYPSADSPVYYRVENYGFKYRKVFMDAISTTLDFPTLPGKPNIIAGYSGTGKYNIFSKYGSDLIFYDPVFCEIPVDDRFVHLGLTGTFDFEKTAVLNYSLKWSSTKTKNPKEFSQYLLDWRMDNFYFNTEYLSGWNKFNYKIGGAFSQSNAITNYALKESKINLYKTYASLQSSYLSNVNQVIDLMIINNGRQSAFKSSFRNSVRLSHKNYIEFNLNYAERLGEEENSLWYWILRGYKIPYNCTINADTNNNSKSTNVFGEIAWTHIFNDELKFKLGTFYNRALNFNYQNQEMIFDPANKTVFSNSFLSSQISGNNFGFSFLAEQRFSLNLSHSLYYSYSTEINSSPLYSNLWNSLPNHKLHYNGSYNYENNFGINIGVTFLSAAQWRNFTTVEKDSEGLYQSKQDSKLLWDVSLLKYFWNKRLKINLIFKNLLNQQNNYTPLGAHFDFSFFLLAELAF